MPGLDRTGPMGMGPMTGGARGRCNPYGKDFYRGGSGPWHERGGGRGRGYRHMYWATGLPGWMRSGPVCACGHPLPIPYSKESEMDFLKDQAAALKEELDAIDSRLRDLESEGKGSD